MNTEIFVNRSHKASGIILCGFVAVFAPYAARAQEPAGAMDSWRASFSEHLDWEIAKLGSHPSSNTVTLSHFDQNAPRDATSNGIRFDSPLAIDTATVPAMVDTFLVQQGLPAGLLSIVRVESGFNPVALSPRGAAGLWQLMPDTARRYGLAVDARDDERLDPSKATVAAAAYLRDLYARFRSWPLVLAAYNAGEERVQQAMDRLGTRDFWTLSRALALPEETRRYVPRVLFRAGSGFEDRFPELNSFPRALSGDGGMSTSDNRPIQKSHIVFATVSPENTARSGDEPRAPDLPDSRGRVLIR